MAPIEQWMLVAQRYAERRADLLVAGAADLRDVNVDERLDIRAQVERAGFAAFAENPVGPLRHTVDVGCRKQLAMELRDRAQRARRARGTPARDDGITLRHIDELAVPIVSRTVRARYVSRPRHAVDEMIQVVRVRTVERVMRRFDSSRGLTLEQFIGVTVGYVVLEELKKERKTAAHVDVVDDIQTVIERDGGGDRTDAGEFEQAECRAQISRIDAWADRSNRLTDRERAAWFGRRRNGGQAGDTDERRAFADALTKVRAHFGPGDR